MKKNNKIMINDIKTDIVYSLDEEIKEFESCKEELYCEYSGLPSPKAYENLE